MDVSGGFDWLAQQNGGQFDPQLFRDYRDPQESVLATANFDDLFADMDADFLTPYNMPVTQQAMPKRSLIAEIDAKQNADDEPSLMVKSEKFNCNEMWYVLGFKCHGMWQFANNPTGRNSKTVPR
jgi:AP-1-like factor